MPAFRLAIPFILLLGLGAYLTIQVDTSWSFLMIIGLTILVSGFVLAPQINWWWWQRFPPDLPAELAKLLDDRLIFYRKLSDTEQREFRRRAFMFNQGNNFMAKVMEKIPIDIQLMIASPAVSLTFRKEEFLFPNFENIVVYPHPFPSPQYQDKFHSSEIYEPDGVVMFCLEHVLKGFVDPRKYLNPAWYEYARIFKITYPSNDYGDWSAVEWKELETVSGFSHEALRRWVGLPDLDMEAMGIAFYFVFPTKFEQELPMLYQQLNSVFQQK